jgi:hypothetical protein
MKEIEPVPANEGFICMQGRTRPPGQGFLCLHVRTPKEKHKTIIIDIGGETTDTYSSSKGTPTPKLLEISELLSTRRIEVRDFGFRGDMTDPDFYLRDGMLFEKFKKGRSLKKPTVRPMFHEVFMIF